jgi:hypothetical protein
LQRIGQAACITYLAEAIGLYDKRRPLVDTRVRRSKFLCLSPQQARYPFVFSAAYSASGHRIHVQNMPQQR